MDEEVVVATLYPSAQASHVHSFFTKLEALRAVGKAVSVRLEKTVPYDRHAPRYDVIQLLALKS